MLAKLVVALVIAACAAPPPAAAPRKGCEPLEADEHELIGRPGYDPEGCTRFERTSRMTFRFD
jgi:hypothetical protein